MVGRSIVVKMYLYGTAVILISLPITFSIGQWFMESARRESARQYVGQMAGFIEHEVVLGMKGTQPPSEQQLKELSFQTGHQLHFVPWSDAAGYPADLRKKAFLFDARPMHDAPHHWQRVERDGKPLGALEISPVVRPGRFGSPGSGPRRPPGQSSGLEFAWLWSVVLVLIIVPPLWLWVIRPLKAMEAVANRLGGGDLSTPVSVDRKDEFGRLERAFEGMRVALRGALEQRERLLIDVSHEIRGPLARMTLALPLLKQQGASGPITEIFERELLTVDALVGDLLALFRARAGTSHAMAPTDLADIAQRMLADRAIVAERQGIRITTSLQAAPVWGDERLLARAVGNLLDNALKYTQGGGSLRVETATVAGRSRVTVADDGPGIPAAHLPLIFEPFYRPDDSRSRETGGTGLGLSIVQAIATSQGGDVSLTSDEGQGTTVTLSFPTEAAETGA